MKITVVGIGPGCEADVTPAVADALRKCDVVVGYKYYFKFVERFISNDTQCIDTGMKRERT